MKSSTFILLILGILLIGGMQKSEAQIYKVGDIVENFTLTDRETGLPVSLHDLEGKIIFLEWFAWWCPFCKAAAAQIEEGIVDHYRGRATSAGIPVIHIGLNLQGNAENATQDFIDDYNIGQVLNDFNGAKAAHLFQSGGQPIFAIINGAANSPSHQQWELLYSHLGYNDLTHPIDDFRDAIDSVQAPLALDPPVITTHPADARADTGSPLNLQVTATGDELTYKWRKGGVLIPDATSATYQVTESTLSDAGIYEVVVSNSGGEITSNVANVTIALGFLDSMIADGVPESLRAPEMDADLDGIHNLLEFLNRTNANDPMSFQTPVLEIETTGDEVFLELTLLVDPNISNYQITLQLSVSPGFETDFLSHMLVSEIPENDLLKRTYRSSTPLTDGPHFGRVSASSVAP